MLVQHPGFRPIRSLRTLYENRCSGGSEMTPTSIDRLQASYTTACTS
jgi:hypothetical protein